MTREISNLDDVIDVRNVIERFEEMEAERAEFVDLIEEEGEEDAAKIQRATDDLATWDADNGAEFALLQSLLDDLRGCGGNEQWRGDWYPVTLIRDSNFIEAMQELVSDIGDLPKNIPGYLVIDWEATAKNLQADYSSVEFDGVTYWYR